MMQAYNLIRNNEVTPYAIRYIGMCILVNVIGLIVASMLLSSAVTALIGIVVILFTGFMNVFLLFLTIADMCNNII